MTKRPTKADSRPATKKSTTKKSTKNPVATDRPERVAGGHTESGELLSEADLVTEASEESFPASDPPCYMAVTKPGGPR